MTRAILDETLMCTKPSFPQVGPTSAHYSLGSVKLQPDALSGIPRVTARELTGYAPAPMAGYPCLKVAENDRRSSNPNKQVIMGKAMKANSSLRILIADDNILFLKGLARIFKKSSWEVETCCDGDAAFAAAEKGGFDVILLDYQMPGMLGTDVARKIRALDGPAAEVPIVGISIDDGAQLASRCLESGMNEFITKHSPPQVIENTILRWVEEHGSKG